LAVAQAAAILLVVWLVAGPRTGLELAMNRVVPGPRVVSRTPIEINAEELVFLQSDGAGGLTVARRDLPDEGSSAVDFAYVLLNNFEAMAE
jgi:hypothetical protein